MLASMNQMPTIEVSMLADVAYEEDRCGKIGRPFIVLMIDSRCGCVLSEALMMSRNPADAVAKALISWRLSEPLSNPPLAVLIESSRAFRSKSFVRMATSAGYEIHYRPRYHEGAAEVVMFNVAGWVKPGRKYLDRTNPSTLAELRRDFSCRVAFYNSRSWKRSGSERPELALKSAGAGRPLVLRRVYFSVHRESLKYGFDTEQIRFIWRTASQAYSVDELRSIFAEPFEKLHSTNTYLDYHRVDATSIHSVCKQSLDLLVGQGAAAMRTLARLKTERDRHAFIWCPSLEWARPVASWGDFTNTLLDKLVKDGLATDPLRCKLFAQDLGL